MIVDSEMIEADGLIFSSMNLINNMENEIDFTDQECNFGWY